MSFLKSFQYATRGIFITARNERNMRIHSGAVLLITTLSFLLQITITDFLIVILLFGMVLGAELFNTAIEKICNILRDTYKLPYEGSRDIRDIAAGAVWVQAIIAAIIGVVIFGKYLI